MFSENKYRGVIYMLIGVFFFALMNALAKKLYHIPVHELVFFRSIIVFLVSLRFVLKLKLPILGNNTKWLVIRGVSGLGALLLFFMTLKNMPLASAISLQYLSPIFTVLIASRMNNQPVRSKQWVYFIMAFIGVLCIKGFDDRLSGIWLLAGVSSAFIAGIAYNSIIRCKLTDHAHTIVMHLTLVSLPVTGIWCFFDFVPPSGLDWWILLAMGISTQIAQYCATVALMSGSAAKIAPWNYVGAVFAVLVGYLFFDETIGLLALIGITIIIVSLVLNARMKDIEILDAREKKMS